MASRCASSNAVPVKLGEVVAQSVAEALRPHLSSQPGSSSAHTSWKGRRATRHGQEAGEGLFEGTQSYRTRHGGRGWAAREVPLPAEGRAHFSITLRVIENVDALTPTSVGRTAARPKSATSARLTTTTAPRISHEPGMPSAKRVSSTQAPRANGG